MKLSVIFVERPETELTEAELAYADIVLKPEEYGWRIHKSRYLDYEGIIPGDDLLHHLKEAERVKLSMRGEPEEVVE